MDEQQPMGSGRRQWYQVNERFRIYDQRPGRPVTNAEILRLVEGVIGTLSRRVERPGIGPTEHKS